MTSTVTITRRKAPRLPRVNWPLWIGGLIVVLVGWLAVRGPDLAPKDPLERTQTLQVDGEWLRLPYAPGTPGFPLGSDNDGRDMLSRILWGVGPTIGMVFIVAAVRLGLGTVIGLTAGWSRGRLGRFSDALIRAALAIPVIMVALGGIAAVGVELGIIAFVVGLSLTGWVEAARIIRERTATIRSQVYIEASQSLGAGDLEVLFRHVIRQVMSMLAMLFAFEISSTLMLTAALGFLGYYIGGDVWVQVTDSIAQATSGVPELGQMLATTDTIVTRPWPLLTIGAVVFTIVLGFNLLGEGLRRNASHTVARKRGGLSDRFANLLLLIDDRILWPLGNQLKKPAVRGTVLAVLAVLAAWGAWVRINAWIEANNPPPAVVFDRPIWSSPLGDPAGTRYLPAQGPQSGDVAWTFTDPAGFAGGPAIDQDGGIYAAGLSGLLYALGPDGSVAWQTRLQATPSASPGVGPDGRIYVVDEDGALTAFSPEGRSEWRVNAELGRSATGSPVIGPDGQIYYATGAFLHAVSPDGTPLWSVSTEIQNAAQIPPQVGAEVAFLGQGAVDLESGQLLRWLDPSDVDQFFFDSEGSLYFRKDNFIHPLTPSGDGVTIGEALDWEYESITTGRPQTSGRAPDGEYWMFFSSFSRSRGFGEDTRVVWLDDSGRILSTVHYGTRNSAPIAIDVQNTLYSCGNLEQGYGPMDCQAFAFGEEEPLWTVGMDGFEMAGGALAPGRLYVTTTDGFLHAVGLVEAPATPTPAPTPTSAATDTPAVDSTTSPEETEPPEDDEHEDLVLPPPYTVITQVILTDPSGFVGGPAVSPDEEVFIAGLDGLLYAINTAGDPLWELQLPGKAAGTPLLDGEQLYVLDRQGLNLLTLDGELIWRFEHEAGTAIAGPVIGPDGSIYYTIQAGSKGRVQAVTASGDPLWITEVNTFSYYRPPIVTPNGQLVLFKGEAFSTIDGSPVSLNLEFEPTELIVGADGLTYLLFGETFVRWSLAGNTAILAEERAVAQANPVSAGTLPDGTVWMVYRAGVSWYNQAGELFRTSFSQQAFFEIYSLTPDGLVFACGRNRSDFRQNAMSNCLAFSVEYSVELWNVIVNEELTDFSGVAGIGNLVFAADEEGHLYRIEFSEDGP